MGSVVIVESEWFWTDRLGGSPVAVDIPEGNLLAWTRKNVEIKKAALMENRNVLLGLALYEDKYSLCNQFATRLSDIKQPTSPYAHRWPTRIQ